MAENDINRFVGLDYPIKKNPLGFFKTSRNTDQIKSDLLVLLLTNPNERVMLPNFGTPLRSLVFDQNDTFVQEAARQLIINAISTWEPRIVINAINISVPKTEENEDGHVLQINIEFIDPNNLKEIQTLDLQIPLAQG